MSMPVEKLQTICEAFLNVPRHQTAQIINGELHVMPRPRPRHAMAASNLTGELINPFHRGRGGPGGWIILFEPELHLDDGDILVPDLAGWRSERMPTLPETAYFELMPDWICEILSPSTAREDRVEKMPIYAKQGVTHLWLIDPDAQILEVFVLENKRWLLWASYQQADAVCAPPFEALTFTLDVLWPPINSTQTEE